PGPHEDSCAIVYGDVAGKSVSGALMMMAAHEVLNSLALTHRDPERLMDLANQRLYSLGRRKSFVAVAYLAPTPDGCGIRYLLAGQPQPFLRRRSGDIVELGLPENRIPLGALKNGNYQLCGVEMGPGDLILGYSDGVVDARSPDDEPFGTDRLAQVVADGPDGPRKLVDYVMGVLADFTRGTEPYDDLTLVAVQCDQEAER
ncbi:MAG: serine/threonine-protein phosphatase, partial [Acidobacteriota bacterium]|nr:serine/threonine-protein phosphatase [Acidobacteriota bacterium]